MLVSLKNKLLLTALCGLTIVASCSKGSDPSPVNPVYPPTTPPTVSTSVQLSTNAKFGTIMTDGNGKTLYVFSMDAKGSSECTGGCEIAWPVYYTADLTVPTGVAASDLATITRADGKKQTTYKGWPLYTYANDVAKGDVNGDGSGGIWFVAKPDYSIMLANAQLVGSNGTSYLDGGVEGTGLTQYLTDGAGKTLYAYTPDTFNTNTYTKADLSNNPTWPIYESDILNVPSALKKDMMFQITAAGKKQLTYKGHPLYYYGPDAKRGDNKGVSVPKPGVWPILTINTAPLK
ncbi:hypothetical protein [Pedobacter duraquae]|uniref:Secreted repeat protein with Y-X4-D motif n=1 Tax=Pedobacter duraquae TaxID=425511 RepID=A0A4R6IEW2_9SPHI|nr:hypothetical protein [Pedobacter duraquae]TDO20853.1 secreted repeat protein with Y-X4-D motif [Pedobacter duraquae]